jgi:hypothetical protein
MLSTCAAAQDLGFETQTFDVSDLLAGARPDDKPDPTTRPISPDAPIGRASPSRTEAREAFVRVVRETIDPTSWAPGHVPPAAIALDGDRLIVVQSPDNMRGVENLLKQLRGDGSEKLQRIFDTTRTARTNLDKVALTEAVRSVASGANVVVDVDWGSFQRAAVVPEMPVSVDLSNATPARAVRAIFNAAAGRDVPLRIDATPSAVRVAFDDAAPGFYTRVYNLQGLPAGASGRDPKKPFNRAHALAAIVERVVDVVGTRRLREVNGMIIVTTTPDTHQRITRLLDELDADASRPRAAAKPDK